MKKGSVIDEINGIQLTAATDPAKLLNHQQGIQTLINFHDPKTKATFFIPLFKLRYYQFKNEIMSLGTIVTDAQSGKGEIKYKS
jgi:hypothetical protein